MRADISRFARRMDSQMVEAATRKDDQGWHTVSVMDLISAARRHETTAKDKLTELVTLSNDGQLTPAAEKYLREWIVHEAADAANYLMMVADNASMGRALWADRRGEIPG